MIVDEIKPFYRISAFFREIKFLILRNAVILLLALEHIVLMCLLNVSLLSIATPGSLASFVGKSASPPTLIIIESS